MGLIDKLFINSYDSSLKKLLKTIFATKDEVSKKQDSLVSGTNIKTINGQSILGGGNIPVAGGIELTYGSSSINWSNVTSAFLTGQEYYVLRDTMKYELVQVNPSYIFVTTQKNGIRVLSYNPTNQEWIESYAKNFEVYANKINSMSDSQAPNVEYPTVGLMVEKLGELVGRMGYNEFNTSTSYAVGDIVYRFDELRRFTAAHPAGAWIGSDTEIVSIRSLLEESSGETGVYDVSANNSGTTFASLGALLSAQNLDTLIPVAKRKGGMSIKFVQSSDNKYVQYRYMGTAITGSPNPFLDTANWQGVDDIPTANSKNLVTSGGVYDALFSKEIVVVTATADTGSVATATVGIYDNNDVLIAEGEGEVTALILYGKTYKVKCSRVYDYLTPTEQTFTASIPSRQVTMQYTYIERDVVTLDQTISDSAQKLSGDIQGDVIKEIRSHSHLYLGTPATQSGDTEGTELICQLSDEDSTKYADGTTAALDGSEGDQWMKLPVFWWKIVGVGEAAADGAHDQYRFMFAFAGEPDPSWNKWQGDRNLVGAKEMKVVNGKGRSVSGGQSTGSFTQAQGNAYAAARNLGCQEVTWEWQWMMCILCYAWNGDTNSQKTNGIGSDSYTRTLGVTDQLGMTDTTPAQATSLTSARFWGLEAWWNCKNEWMGNVVIENSVLRITDQNTKQTRQVSGFIQCGGTGGWNSRMRIDANGDFVPLAKEGTETTYYCDWVNSNSGSRVLYRSSANASAYGGVAYVSAYNAPSGAYAHCGSRLAFNGTVTEAESVAAYKAALA